MLCFGDCSMYFLWRCMFCKFQLISVSSWYCSDFLCTHPFLAAVGWIFPEGFSVVRSPFFFPLLKGKRLSLFLLPVLLFQARMYGRQQEARGMHHHMDPEILRSWETYILLSLFKVLLCLFALLCKGF